MFGRHRTHQQRDLATVANAFHERLAGSMVTQRQDQERVDPIYLRTRLAGPASAGLRERLARPRLIQA
jgi:histidine ammonia-lyase